MDKINYDQVIVAVRDFEAAAKTGRVFCAGDAPFEQKFSTFIRAAAEIAVATSDDSITVLDKTVAGKDTHPRKHTITSEDALAIFDNTKLGLFGNIAKKDCQAGLLVARQGFLVYNIPEKGVLYYSGFVSWETMSAAYVGSDGFEKGIVIYKNHKKRPTLVGPQVAFIFENAASKTLKDNLMVLFGHFRYISRGRGSEFDPDDWSAEVADECVLCEEVDECTPEDLVDECVSCEEADEDA